MKGTYRRALLRRLLFPAVVSVWVLVPSAAFSAPSGGPKYIYYEGIVTSINAKTGDLVIVGNREDLPDEIIVKLKVDPKTVEVTDNAQHDLDLTSVEKEDQIDADCRVEGNELIVESIYIYATKDPDADAPTKVEHYKQDVPAEVP